MMSERAPHAADWTIEVCVADLRSYMDAIVTNGVGLTARGSSSGTLMPRNDSDVASLTRCVQRGETLFLSGRRGAFAELRLSRARSGAVVIISGGGISVPSVNTERRRSYWRLVCLGALGVVATCLCVALGAYVIMEATAGCICIFPLMAMYGAFVVGSAAGAVAVVAGCGWSVMGRS